MLKGVIFDMDGVLVDSEPFICRASTLMFAEHGLTVEPDDFLPFVGAGEDRYIGGVAEKYGLVLDPARDKARTYQIYDEIVRGQLEPLNGVQEFIKKCRERGLKLAVASSADMVKIKINLREIGVAFEAFDVVQSGDDITHKKPDPEIFQKAAARLGIAPSESLVVEDAVNGVAAAKSAGAKCLGITSTFTAEELANADWHSPDLASAPEEAIGW
jgi:HAD superfamily hydrolase (TIGR01509 family)